MSKLKYYTENGEKKYTLKKEIDKEQTKDAHYKYIKILK